MKHLCIFLMSILMNIPVQAQEIAKKKLYLIPGQGADGRLFKNLQLEDYDTTILEFIRPEKKEDMASYARRMASRIDTSKPFFLLGVSLGGMVAVEISKFLQPEKTIIISSIKGKREIPGRYKIFRKLPLHRLLGGRFYKWGTRIAQPMFEPLEAENKELFHAMVKAKDPKFMKRAIRCIVEWENEVIPENILHIHGTDDHTLPYKSVNADITIDGGTHMMVLRRGEEISGILKDNLD